MLHIKKIAFANLYVLQRGDTEEAGGGEAGGGRHDLTAQCAHAGVGRYHDLNMSPRQVSLRFGRSHPS